MSPQQPKVCRIRSSRLPMKPVTPEGPGRRCVKVSAVTKTVIEKEKKPRRRNRNGLNQLVISEGKNLLTDSRREGNVPR